MKPSDDQPNAVAVLLAAGRSERMSGASQGQDLRKPFLELEGATVLEHACDAFRRAGRIDSIVVVAHRDDVARVRSMATASQAMATVTTIVEGGELRTDSTRLGIAAASGSALVAIHDVARPLIRPAVIDDAVETASRVGAAVVAVPTVDTIKTSSDGIRAESTLDRAVLWQAQTPQVFRTELVRDLLARAAAEDFRATDDAALHERYAGPVTIVEGERWNVKLTTPEDLLVAAALLRARRMEDGVEDGVGDGVEDGGGRS